MARILSVWLVTSLLSVPSNGVDHGRAISQFTHTSWTAKDGIPGPVRAIAQTQDGYLWLGTEAGLYRFDGVQFALWKPARGDRLPGISVCALHTAEDGSLWIGFGSGGVSRLYKGHLTSYPPGQGVPNGGILSIVSDHSGIVWIAGQYGFSRLGQGTWHPIGPDEGYPAPAAQTLLLDHNGTLWVATDGYDFHSGKNPARPNTILFLSPNADRFSRTGLAFGEVWQMTEAPDGSVWAADSGGHAAKRISNASGEDSAYVVDDEAKCLLFGGDRSLWIGLIDHGIRRIGGIIHKQRAVVDSFQARDGLSSGPVYSTLKDREGNIWFGTGSGLDRFRADKFTPYSAREGLIPAQRIALASTGEGIWMIEYVGDSVRQFRDDHSTAVKLPDYSPTDTTRILSLYADHHNDLWLGGSFHLAHRTDGAFAFVSVPVLAPGEMIEAITKDVAGNLWVTATKSGTVGAIFRQSGRTWTDLRAVADLPHFRCRVLYGDPLGRVWLGFEDGEVALYDRGNFYQYSSKDGLFGGRVLTITSDRSGRIWIGGEGGLSHFESGHFTTLTKENGLPGDSVAAIIEDDQGALWLAGGLGVFRVTPSELTKAVHSKSYRMEGLLLDANDGLRGLPRQHEPFPVAARGTDGRLWFATTEGVAVIDPQHIPTNTLPPPVTVEEVKADDQTFAPSTGFHLQPRTRNVQFKFTALSVAAPERVRFRYKLEGFDDDWHGPANERQVTYTNLPPRDYRFRVIACNNDGVWNEEGATLGFTILPAFYQTDWFLMLCVATGVYLAWIAYRYRERQVRGLLDMQFGERLSERTRIAGELHDTLLQSFQGLILHFQRVRNLLPANPGEAVQRLDIALERAEKAIVEGRNAIQNIRSSTVIEGDLAQALTALGEELGPGGGGGSEALRVVVEGVAKPLRPILRDEIYRIIREALRNAFQHARAQHIEAEIVYGKTLFRVRIRDDGEGIDPNILDHHEPAGHWGLVGMRERAKRIGGQLQVWSERQAGTEVELTVPGSIAYGSSSGGNGFNLFRKRVKRDE